MIENQWILRLVLQFEISPKGQHHALLRDHNFSLEKTPAVNFGWMILTLRNGILHPMKRWIMLIGPFNADSLQESVGLSIVWWSDPLTISDLDGSHGSHVHTWPHGSYTLIPDIRYPSWFFLFKSLITYHCLDYLHYFAFLHDVYSNIKYPLPSSYHQISFT